jgi:hypothetical protein
LEIIIVFLCCSISSGIHPDAVVKSGLGAMARDPVLRDEIQDRIDRVVLAFDEEHVAFYTCVLTPDKDLLVTINLAQADSYLHRFEEKMDKILNMRFAQARRDWEKTKRKEQMGTVCRSVYFFFFFFFFFFIIIICFFFFWVLNIPFGSQH